MNRQAVTNPSAEISPSRRDPIENWLDLFVRMLALPRRDVSAVRDELEDHLRSRVDDLLITGISEPEAVQRAVAELGETAELARGFRRAAHATRRRTLVNTALIALAGGAVALGSVVAFDSSAPSVVTETTGSTVLLQPATASFNENLRRYDVSELTMADSPLEHTDGAEVLADTIMALVEPESWEDYGGDGLFRISGNTLFVTSTEEVHAGVLWVIESLREDAAKIRQREAEWEEARWQEHERAKDRERAEARRADEEYEQRKLRQQAEDEARRAQLIEELTPQYEDLKDSMIMLTTEHSQLEIRHEDARNRLDRMDPDSEDRADLVSLLANFEGRAAALELSQDDVQVRLHRIRNILLDLEMAEYTMGSIGGGSGGSR